MKINKNLMRKFYQTYSNHISNRFMRIGHIELVRTILGTIFL